MVSIESTVTMLESPLLQTNLEEKFRGSTGPSVLERRLKAKVIEETAGESTTDTDGTDTGSETLHESDADAVLEVLEIDDVPGAVVDTCNTAYTCNTCESFLMSPDPFDYMPSVRVRAAFSERQVTQVLPAEWQNDMYSVAAPVMQPVAQPQMQPMQMPMPPMQMAAMQPMVQRMDMPPVQQIPMQSMQQMPAMASSASNPSPGPIMVPVPVPVPFQMPMAMPKFSPQSVPVPAGFKLVKIPEATPEKSEAKAVYPSAISNPASTERKIFVGGLNPATTGQTLREYFATFGPVIDAKVIRDGEKSKGFGFVQFKESIPAEVLDQAHIIDQRRCGVGPAFHRDCAEVVA